MFDLPIMPETATVGAWIYQGIIFCIIFFCFKNSCQYQFGIAKKSSTIWLAFFVILWLVTAFTNGDYSHYQMMVKSYSGPGSTGLEDVYEKVIVLTNQNYLLFRTLLFGGMVLLLLRLFRNFGLDQCNSLFFLFCVYVGTLAYSRASIGMTFYFLGLSVLFSERNKTTRLFLGWALIIASYYFHRSCIVLIPLTLLGYFPINKKTIPIVLGVVALSFFALKGLTSSIIHDIMMSDNEDLAHKAELYASGAEDGFSGNIIAWIMHIWEWGVFYVIFFVDAYFVLYQKQEVTSSIQRLFSVTFGILLFAILMNLFDMTSAAMYYRYLFMLMIPTTIVTTYLYQKSIMPLKVFKFVFWFGCIPTIENILYHIYYLLSH